MGFLSALRCQDASASVTKDGFAGFSAVLSEVKGRVYIDASNFQIEKVNQPDAKTQC